MSWKTSTCPSQAAPAPIPIVGIGQLGGDAAGDRGRHALEHDREAAGRLERPCVGDELAGLRRRPALGLEAAEHRRRLRRQADVAHHGHAGADDRAHAVERRARALELDGVHARLLDEAHGVAHRVLVGDLVGAEGHVGDDERPPRAARCGAREEEHVLHRGRDGGVVAEHGHGGGVADEDEVDARRIGEPAARVVVGGHHDDPLAASLHLGEVGERQLPGGVGRVVIRGLLPG